MRVKTCVAASIRLRSGQALKPRLREESVFEARGAMSISQGLKPALILRLYAGTEVPAYLKPAFAWRQSSIHLAEHDIDAAQDRHDVRHIQPEIGRAHV